MKAFTAKAKRCTFNVEEYTSAMELVDTLKKRPVTEQWKNETDEVKHPKKSWAGVDSYDEALNLLKNGWTEKLNEMKTLANKVATKSGGKRISFMNDVAGFAPIVPLAMMNVPNAMIDMHMKPIKSKVVKIVYNITISCMIKPDTILKNGMKVVEAVINLENSGYRCEVVAMQNYYDNKYSDTLLLKIKEANQPLDLKRIMFPLIHPGMFRVIGFDWENKLPTGKHMFGRGRAIGYEFGNETANIFKEAFGDNCFYIDNTMLEKEDSEYIENTLKGEKDPK